nr:hypothetical protein [uncultured Rhodopila sp.]
MSQAVQAASAATAPVRRSGAATRLRLAPFESEPAVIAFVQTAPGRFVLAAAFGGLLYLRLQQWVPLLFAAACAWSPAASRRHVVAVIGFGLVILDPFWFNLPVFSAIAAREGAPDTGGMMPYAAGAGLIAVSCAVVAYARRRPASLPARRPVLCLLAAQLALMLLCGSELLQGSALIGVWAAVLTLGPAMWFLCYAIADVKAQGSAVPLLRPFWSMSGTPFGKGWSYLSKFAAKNPAELAVTQLKGTRLLAWALMLDAVRRVLAVAVHGQAGIPVFASVMAVTLRGGHSPWYICWASLISAFFENLLEISVWGHTIIAIARFAGFRLLRNTYRPLESRTIAEFWNRYYFYFKELLVDFFFYPAFLRCFRQSEGLRIAFATVMAACVGNMAYHFTRDSFYIASVGLKQAIIGFQTYAFYCVMLTAGICISQWRSRRHRTKAVSLPRRVAASAGVMLFFCLLHVFDDERRTYSLIDHARFLLQLFGADT